MHLAQRDETHLLIQQMLIMLGRVYTTVSKIEPKELVREL